MRHNFGSLRITMLRKGGRYLGSGAGFFLGHPVPLRKKQGSFVTCHFSLPNEFTSSLKEYYEIVEEARPLSGFFPHTCWFFVQKCISNHETKQSFKFQSDPSPNCFTIDDIWNINCWQFLSFLLFFCISFYTSSVVFWHEIFSGTIFYLRQ